MIERLYHGNVCNIFCKCTSKKNDHLHIVIYEYERLLSTEPGICIRYMP